VLGCDGRKSFCKDLQTKSKRDESDSDWLRAMRLKKACEAGDKLACEKYKDMQNTKLYAREDILASKEVGE